MDEKCVLFGAGRAGMAAINYVGKEKIVAVIDNNSAIVGTLFEGIPVISLKEYLKNYNGMQIVVGIQSDRYHEILTQLNESGVKNYFTMPPVLYGFYTPEQMVEKFIVGKYPEIALYGINCITDRIEDYIEQTRKEVTINYYVRNERNVNIGDTYRGRRIINIEELPDETALVISTNPAEDNIRKVIKSQNIHNVLDLYELNKSQNERIHPELEKYKNIHEGKRGFVIGNGPSLSAQDLERIKRAKDVSFAANGIFHIYPDTDWRPDYYMIVDLFVYKQWMESGMERRSGECFVPDYHYVDIRHSEDINYFPYLSSIEESGLDFSEDITKQIYSGRTVTYAMLQLACYMGIKEIYLLGVDWTGGKGTGKPRYDFYNKGEALPARPYDLFMDEKRAFVYARKYAEKNGIKIYNATRGGELEVFERVDIDSLF